MCVQVWGLPFDLFSEDVGHDIGRGLGHVIEVDNKALVSNQARFLRILVDIPLDKPISRGGPVQSTEGDKVWVAFKYEWLVGPCFQCGLVGHEHKDCSKTPMQHKGGLRYREWLKAGFRKKNVGSENP